MDAMRRFAGVDLSSVPDETAICKFLRQVVRREAEGLKDGRVGIAPALSVVREVFTFRGSVPSSAFPGPRRRDIRLSVSRVLHF